MLPYVKTGLICRLLGESDDTLRRRWKAGEMTGVKVYKRGAHTEWCAESVWYWMAHRDDPEGCADVELILAWAESHPLPEWLVAEAAGPELVAS